ncbi:hypothetical protein WALSEDRAFT_58034 [Wallemia mellicola CBS 633.66]|uniref:Uncharacterized protein n=1 Tax=Wallemia mellicola (strain ATCC MYA-4683 / CBS 633.66) TaxID=671144 RepID=I4Y9X4_WALMC|nr:hypothetical protein WALSEDRAFT_58034 [Wallemia mellicola CBS 633.66]EIM20766.1 hypothetical protein WALSEDRAFT_58034 [Wallemia mellicola CBS 633.66]|eukprot:XP_006959292.1 hypothetical protein WALSEDRAFT_58034 [Wallemia mellicola CBS 633.66]
MSQSEEDFKDFSQEEFGDEFGEFENEEDLSVDLLESEEERQVGFDKQILVTQYARDIHQDLSNTALPKALDYDYSYTRRQFLLVLGKPLNLDEIKVNKLPPLQLSLNQQDHTPTVANTSKPENTPIDPAVDIESIQLEIDNIDTFTLNLIPITELSKLRDNLRSNEQSVNQQLTYNLEQLDTLRNDNETYNTLISDLIKETNNKLSKNYSMRSKIQPKSVNLMERTGSAGLWGPNNLPKTPPERVLSPGLTLSGNRVNW